MTVNPKLVCLGSQVKLFGPNTRETISCLPKYDWEIRAENKVVNPMAHPWLTHRKSALLDAGLYNKSYFMAEDHEMIGRLLCKGKFLNLDEPLTKYRIHENQMSSYLREEGYPLELSALAENNLLPGGVYSKKMEFPSF
jgi:hypothetical protein